MIYQQAIILNKAAHIFILFLTITVAGCATIINGDSQDINVATYCRERSVAATCSAKNDKGTWVFSTPSKLRVLKSSEELKITCEGDFIGNYGTKINSHASIEMLGNILVGGGIGAVIDANNNNGYKYAANIFINIPLCGNFK